MTNNAAPRASWQTPELEPLTDTDATADQVAPIRNAITSIPF